MNVIIMKFTIILLALQFTGTVLFAQNVGINTTAPDSSAALDVHSSDKGFLPPRLTTAERNGIRNPAAGLQIFNTSTNCLEMFVLGRWQQVFCGVADTTTTNDSSFVTDIDGNRYPTVNICNQTWMAKNLDVARYRNGDPIPYVSDTSQWTFLTTGARCWYKNDSVTYGSVYGKLYNWSAATDLRGVCPTGWHVPSDDEWTTLTNCLGGPSLAGAKLKETGTYHWVAPNAYATNSSGFTALPGGYVYGNNGEFFDLGIYGGFWSTDNATFGARVVNVSDGNITSSSGQSGWSIRCIKDNPPPSTLDSGLVAFYPFNGNANDESGNGNNGVVNGATLTSDRFGNNGKAYGFDGVNDCISISGPSLCITSSEVTISVWVYVRNWTNPGGYLQATVIQQGSQNFYHLQFGPESSGDTLSQINYQYQGRAYSSKDAPPYDCDVKLNQWNNVVFTLKNNIGNIYLNGTLMRSYSGYAYGNTNCPGEFFLGKEGNTFLNGLIDELRIYNRALTQEEITYLATH